MKPSIVPNSSVFLPTFIFHVLFSFKIALVNIHLEVSYCTKNKTVFFSRERKKKIVSPNTLQSLTRHSLLKSVNEVLDLLLLLTNQMSSRTVKLSNTRRVSAPQFSIPVNDDDRYNFNASGEYLMINSMIYLI